MNTITKNIWVSASAGSGKTKVLTDRFLGLLLNGVAPQKILCITFTKAAATEMLSRITDELSLWLTCDDMHLFKKVEELTGTSPSTEDIKRTRNCIGHFLDVQNELHIETIHSFCQYIIQKFPLECNVDLNFKIADEYLKDSLMEQAKDRLLHDNSIFNHKDIQHLFDNLNETKLKTLLEKVLFINSSCPNLFASEKTISQYVTKLCSELRTTRDYNEGKEQEKLTTSIINLLNENNKLLCSDIAITARLKEVLDDGVNAVALPKIKALFFTKQSTPRLTLLYKKERETHPQLASFLQDIQQLIGKYIEESSAHKVIKQTSGFLHLGHIFLKHYNQVKKDHATLDYDDLIKRCLTLLEDEKTSSWIRCYLNEKFSHIMIDEAQDVSLTQWRLIRILVSEFFHNTNIDHNRTIFVVGDPKQSIYSFQGTSPYLFLGMEQVIKDFGAQFNIDLSRLDLNTSYRSDKVILEFVDKVFAKIKEQNPDLFFEEELKHIPYKKFENASVEVWPVVMPLLSKSPEISTSLSPNSTASRDNKEFVIPTQYQETTSPPKILADKIATRIKELLDQGYAPSDIMILVRKRDVLVEQLVKSLKANSIPASGLDRLILNKNLAIRDLIALANFLLFPYDDYNLACLLKSPLFSVTEEDLFELCQREELSLWQNICKHNHASFTLLDSLMESKELHSPYALFSHVLDVLTLRTSFVARFGLHINEVLDEFLNLCLKFEDDHHKSLTSFVHWFERNDFEIKRDTNLSANETKIMTVHGAKGLQSKVVILPDTTSVPLYNKDGILFDLLEESFIYKTGTTCNTYQNLSKKIELQTLQEYYRLLYVALTRAAEKLIICGWSGSKKAREESWYQILSNTAKSIHQDIKTSA